MDELVVTQVDAGMADATAAIGAEEQQVTWLELVARHFRGIDVDHFTRGARQRHARLFAEQVTDEATAVEAGLFRGTTEAVAGADQRHAALENAVSQNRQLVRLAAGERRQVIFGGQLFRLAEHRRRRGFGVDCRLCSDRRVILGLGYRALGRAAKKQGHECEWHEGCEALQHGHDRVCNPLEG
ncbi:hypothetical protein D9M73_176670 [compost metagenome]